MHQRVQAHAPDEVVTLRPYADRWQDGDLAPIPEDDLPAGCPAWMRGLEAWAQRTGPDRDAKRATITTTIPVAERAWRTRSSLPDTENPPSTPDASVTSSPDAGVTSSPDSGTTSSRDAGTTSSPDAAPSAAHKETHHGP